MGGGWGVVSLLYFYIFLLYFYIFLLYFYIFNRGLSSGVVGFNSCMGYIYMYIYVTRRVYEIFL